MLSVTHFLLLYDTGWVTFLDAIRKGKWIRRKGRPRPICVSETPTHLYDVVRSDLLADDWEVIEGDSSEPADGSTERFSLMELD